jgi:[ribosomal protein S18]-alanine N-acetyltransferase
MRPDFTGKGFGRHAIETGLAFGRDKFSPPAFRVTIASFNLRARRVVETLGFREVSTFRAAFGERTYAILVRPEPGR